MMDDAMKAAWLQGPQGLLETEVDEGPTSRGGDPTQMNIEDVQPRYRSFGAAEPPALARQSNFNLLGPLVGAELGTLLNIAMIVLVHGLRIPKYKLSEMLSH